MKQLLISVGFLALLAFGAAVTAEPLSSIGAAPFDVSSDEFCWVAPEWRD